MSEKEEVIANLRAVLISRKGPATLFQLAKDYRELDGQTIPYKKFGYRSLEEFLRSDQTFKLHSQSNETFVSVAPKKESRHISDMIAKQKCNTKKRSRSAPVPRALRSGYDRNNSRWVPNSQAYNARRSPIKTSKSAQLYAGQPSRQISFSARHENGHTRNNTSTQQRLAQAKPVVQIKSEVHVVPKPTPTTSQQQPKPIVQTSTQNSDNATFNSIPSQANINLGSSTSKMRMPQVTENMQRTIVNFDMTSVKESYKTTLNKNPPKVESRTVPGLSEPNQRNGRGISDGSKRSIIDLETVTSSGSRNVNIIPSNRYESTITGAATKSSAQDRLNRIRQHQPAAGFTEPPEPVTKSQQSRLQKYKCNNAETQSNLSLLPNSQKADSVCSFDKNMDYEQSLHEYCFEKNLCLPEIRVIRHNIPQTKFKSDRPSAVYGCKIKIGDECTYGSYSDMFSTPEEATQAAAKNTLEALLKSYGTLDERDLPTTDASLIPQRLLKLVAGHANGKFMQQLSADYREEYHENMPDDWLKHVEQSRLFKIENSVGGSQIISVNRMRTLVDLKSKKNHEDLLDPSAMTLPALEGFWNVLITNVCSTMEIWGRIIGDNYSGLYDELLIHMEVDLMTRKTSVEKVQIGGYYAVSTIECWVRIQVLEIDEDRALCFYIDTGEEEWHKIIEIYKLEQKFRYVPPQAVLLQLAGLQEYAENKCALNYMIEYLLNKALVAEIVQNEHDDRVIPVILYDTYTSEDINLNAILLKKMKDEAKAPKLKEKGRINEVFVSHVSDKGHIYIQIRNDSFKYLLSQIQLITDIGFGEEQVLQFVNVRDPDKLYLSVNAEENNGYRVTVTGQPDKGKVPVFFVDYGHCGHADITKLFALDKLSSAIVDFPYQALKVMLNGMPSFTPSLASRLRACLPRNKAVLLKVTEPEAIPLVEIFMRTQDDLLISVNNALQNELEIERNAEEVECRPLSRHIERMSFMPRASRNKPLPPSPEKEKFSPKSLPEPDIPCDGSFYPVLVSTAASPANFVIQPIKEPHDELSNLMQDLQSLCTNSPSRCPSYSEIAKGNLYAGLHSDGTWYRVQVTNVMSNNCVTVHFCDYGDYDVMSCNNLQKLTTPFLQIPYFALRARLSDVSPQYGDWNVSDCLRFQELVCEKRFVAVINSIDPDELNAPDKILSITLIDTTTEKDIYITAEMFREQEA